MNPALAIGQIIVSIALVVAILLQARGTGLSGTFGGDSAVYRSRRGIERLGAKQDGILRNHTIAPNGTLRDTVVYSIIASEWPTVKAHLTYQLNEKPR